MIPYKLFSYLSKKFLRSFLAFLVGFLAIIFLLEFSETLRTLSGKDISFSNKINYLFLTSTKYFRTLLPFIFSFSFLHTYWKLQTDNELIPLLSAGISYKQLYFTGFIFAFVIGIIYITIIQPIEVNLNKKANILKIQYNQKYARKFKTNDVGLTKTGFWLKENFKDKKTIIHASSIDKKKMEFNDVYIITFYLNNDYKNIIKSKKALLKNGEWLFKNATLYENNTVKEFKEYKIQTNYSKEEIEKSFSKHELISFWKMKDTINEYKKNDLFVAKHEFFYNYLLSLPFLYGGITGISCYFALRKTERVKNKKYIFYGVISTFIIFIFIKIIDSIAPTIPEFSHFLGWVPAVIIITSSLFLISLLEDKRK